MIDNSFQAVAGNTDTAILDAMIRREPRAF